MVEGWQDFGPSSDTELAVSRPIGSWWEFEAAFGMTATD